MRDGEGVSGFQRGRNNGASVLCSPAARMLRHGLLQACSMTRSSHNPCVLERRHMICIAMRAARGYYVVLYRSPRLIRREDGRAAVSGFDSTRPAGKGP
jgi:hypothetical protein